MPKFIEKEYKTIISKQKMIDYWFWTKYSINPYNGCLFGCVYCDARSAKYHMPLDFENEILVKKNVSELLHQQLRTSRSFEKDVVGIGGVTDSYQPAEQIYRNTRGILKVLAKHRYPIHLITKSTRVLEDQILFQKIAQQNYCTLSITITTVDDELAKFLDFRAPSPTKRLEVIRKIKQETPEIQCGALLLPLVPFFGDDKLSLEKYFQAVKATGADYILFGGGMTLRDQQGLFFLRKVKEKFPHLISEYEKLYKFTYDENEYVGEYVPDGKYLLEKHQFLFELSEKYEIPFRIKRFIPNDFRGENYQIAEKLFQESFFNQMSTGKNWEHLFWAAHDIQNLKSPIRTLAQMGMLDTIKNVSGEILVKIETLLNLK